MGTDVGATIRAAITRRAVRAYVCVGAFFAGFLYFFAGFFLAGFLFSAANAPSEATMAAVGRTTVAPNAATMAAINSFFTGHLHGEVARRPNVSIGCADKSIGTIPEIAQGHHSIRSRRLGCRTSTFGTRPNICVVQDLGSEPLRLAAW
jgi:hypothetical protein